MSMEEALAYVHCTPDCALPTDAPVLYGHRTTPDAEIYFISNQENREITVSPEFRVKGKQPELWNAISGKIRTLSAYKQTESGTIVPMKLYPYESAFVVFRKNAGKPAGESVEQNFPTPETFITLNQPWQVTFKDTQRGPKEVQTFQTLTDLSKHEDDPIRYYSGTVTYTSSISVPEIPQGDLYLNLNNVGVMAKVKVNGQYAGDVWTPPYRVEVTDLLQPGENNVEIEVVTTWQNRLIGDSMLPEEERTTWIPCNNWSGKDALQKSGLIGPVTLESDKFTGQ